MKHLDIRQHIRRRRKMRGLSQEALAGRVGVSVARTGHTETGDRKLSLPVPERIAGGLSVGAGALLSDALEPDKATFSVEVQEMLVR